MKAEITVSNKTYWTILIIGCGLIVGSIVYALVAGNIHVIGF